MTDPKVQQVLNALRMGAPLDIRQVGRTDPQLFGKLKYLIDRGVLGLSA